MQGRCFVWKELNLDWQTRSREEKRCEGWLFEIRTQYNTILIKSGTCDYTQHKTACFIYKDKWNVNKQTGQKCLSLDKCTSAVPFAGPRPHSSSFASFNRHRDLTAIRILFTHIIEIFRGHFCRPALCHRVSVLSSRSVNIPGSYFPSLNTSQSPPPCKLNRDQRSPIHRFTDVSVVSDAFLDFQRRLESKYRVPVSSARGRKRCTRTHTRPPAHATCISRRQR